MGGEQRNNLKLTVHHHWTTVLAAAGMLAVLAAVVSLAPPNGAIPASAAPSGVTLTPGPNPANVGQTVTFTATATATLGQTLTSFTFSFGDGGTAIVPGSGTTATVTANHVYTTANTYLASVTASDTLPSTSAPATASETIKAVGAITVTASASPNLAAPGQTVSFPYTVTDPNTGATVTIAVTFGDGTSGTFTNGASITHIYLTPGNFTVTLTATDTAGGTGSGSTSVSVAGTGFGGGLFPNPGLFNPTPSYFAPVSTYAQPVTTYTAPVVTTASQPAISVSAPITSYAPPASAGVSVSVQAGWHLMGGPDGTVLNGNIGSVYTLQAGDNTYENLPGGTALRAGFGYWVYFSSPTTNVIPSAPGQSINVQLPAGQFVMIGNPGSGNATVTGADYVAVFNPSTNQYVQSNSLVPGQGGWGWSGNGGTATITSS